MPWTGIQWGGFTNHLRVGIDVGWDNYDTWTPSINVYVAVYVGNDNWPFDDNQHISLSGSVGAEWDYHNGMGNSQVLHIGTAVIGNQGQSYGGGPDYWFSAALSGNYLGAGPSQGVGFRLPARPIRPPSAAGAPFVVSGTLTANGGQFGWAGPADSGGSGVDWNWLEIATANYANVIYSNQQQGTAGRTLTTLAPNSTFFTRAAWHNAAGWGPWGPVSSFSTLPFQAAKPTLTNVQPDNVTVNWTAPAGGTPTGWQMQVARDANFADIVQTPSSTSWTTSATVTNLSPATLYYYRVRANTAYGYGAWSAAETSQTLSGAKVRMGGLWVNGTAWIRSGGLWVVAKVNKRDAGVWKL